MPSFDQGIRAHIFARPGQRGLVERLAPQQSAQTRLAGQQEVGSTQHFVVFTDGTADGNASAQAVLQNAEADFAAIAAWFGGLQLPPGQEGDDQTVVRTALPIQVAMDSQAGGAYHYSCAGTDVYIEPVPAVASGLVVAEVVEIFEAAQNQGWDCGQTNGEGLSRVLAFERSPQLSQDFVNTEQYWWSNGHADYVNDNSGTDQDEAGNGCGTLFLFYLHSQLNYTWEQVVAAAGPTLGATYQQLTGVDPQTGFQDFVLRLSTLDNGSGQLNLPSSGNPFPINQQAPSAPTSPSSTGTTATSGTPGGMAGPSAGDPSGTTGAVGAWGSSAEPSTMSTPATSGPGWRGIVLAIVGLIIVLAIAYYLLKR
jgi:hypothetical protein